MKKFSLVSSLALVMVMMFLTSANSQSVKSTKSEVSNTPEVEVYYFHFTRRCVTCKAVETETQKSINALYPSQVKNGKITFKSINLDEKSNDELAKKCKTNGQALLVMSNGKRIELTQQAFMYARSSPAKLKAELKKTIDSLL